MSFWEHTGLFFTRKSCAETACAENDGLLYYYEHITFPQLRWQEVKILVLYSLLLIDKSHLTVQFGGVLN